MRTSFFYCMLSVPELSLGDLVANLLFWFAGAFLFNFNNPFFLSNNPV